MKTNTGKQRQRCDRKDSISASSDISSFLWDLISLAFSRLYIDTTVLSLCSRTAQQLSIKTHTMVYLGQTNGEKVKKKFENNMVVYIMFVGWEQ